jgi:hypothetical protein
MSDDWDTVGSVPDFARRQVQEHAQQLVEAGYRAEFVMEQTYLYAVAIFHPEQKAFPHAFAAALMPDVAKSLSIDPASIQKAMRGKSDEW